MKNSSKVVKNKYKEWPKRTNTDLELSWIKKLLMRSIPKTKRNNIINVFEFERFLNNSYPDTQSLYTISLIPVKLKNR